ncbi:MAG: dihydrodipicolinate synthase family protein [Solirubrobacteraceae bacterium]
MTRPEPLFRGIGVALVTLFEPDGALLVDATAQHAGRLADRGVAAIVVGGTTGEASALAPDERSALIATVRGAVPGPVPVIAGTGAPTAAEAVALTRAAAHAGADAALVLSPPGVEDPSDYYATLSAEAGDLPLLAYHFPLVSPPGIPLEVLASLPTRGVKDSSGNAERLAFMVDRYAGEIYVGSATLLALAGPLGATGAILALANVLPERCAVAWAGDTDAQRALFNDHLAAADAFPRALKERMAAEIGTPTGVRHVLS